ncbi:MAG TPA: hypothetical protein VMF55_09075 [Solirubrobacterales bacterium]|nr:hypothetical protein [Solirubrobacterales bacterium]
MNGRAHPQRPETGSAQAGRVHNRVGLQSSSAIGAAGRSGLLAALCVLLWWVIGSVGVPEASAAGIHPFKETFGSAAQPTFPNPAGITVDGTTGDLLVIDPQEAKLQRFHPDGTPANFSALGSNVIDGKEGPDETPQGRILNAAGQPYELEVAVDESSGPAHGDIYVTSPASHLVDIFASTGEYVGQLTASSEGAFGEACGVTVDESGAVYVAEYEGHVHKFVPTANPPVVGDNADNFAAPSPCLLSAGRGPTAGDLFVAEYEGGVRSYEAATGALRYTVSSDKTLALNVDPASGHVYVGKGQEVVEYDASGTSAAAEVSKIGLAGAPRGVAVSGSSGMVYVDREGNTALEVFGPLAGGQPPRATTEPATDVTNASAVLHAIVNPEEAETTCRFQITSASRFAAEGFLNSTSAPCEPAGPFDGTSDVTVSAALLSLHPGHDYRFRVSASSGNGTTVGLALAFSTEPDAFPNPRPQADCPNEPFRTGASARLPDCRAYELVTPPGGDGSPALGKPGIVKASTTGDGITYYSPSAIPGGRGAQTFPTYLARPGAADWTTQGVLPPQGLGDSAFVIGYSSNLKYAITEVTKIGAGTGLLIEDTVTREITTVVPYQPGASCPQVGNQNGAECFAYVGGSADGSLLFFESTLPLGSGSAPGTQNLFVWRRSTGAVELADKLPAGEGGNAPSQGAFGGAYLWPFGETSRGGAFEAMLSLEDHAVSASGNQVFFTAAQTGQLYLRSNVAGKPSTIHVSAPEPGVTDPAGPQPAAFQAATPDGARAFFLSAGKLTEDATTGSADQGRDLYRFDVAAGKLRDLTPDQDGAGGAEVQGVLGISQDGSVVYFAANGVLPGTAAEGASPGNCDNETQDQGALARTCNLYRYSEQNGLGKVMFISRVDGTGGLTVAARTEQNDATNWLPLTRYNSHIPFPSARVSRDGSTLLFRTFESLAGSDNSECAVAVGGNEAHHCPQFYRYYAPTGELDCISCDPTGVQAVGAPSLMSENIGVNATFANGRKALLPANLSADGKAVFFQTPQALVAGDTNGVGGCSPGGLATLYGALPCQDVYEWEAASPSNASCREAEANGGCLFLLSTGQEATPSFFGGADETGSNAFIFTKAQLVPVDTAGAMDIYDARVGGGLASQHPPASAQCNGEACQGSYGSTPPVSAPSTEVLRGPGNIKHKQHKHKKKHRPKKQRARHKSKKRQNQHNRRLAAREIPAAHVDAESVGGGL